MNTITISYDDGSSATWFIENIQETEDVLINLIGQPDSIQC